MLHTVITYDSTRDEGDICVTVTSDGVAYNIGVGGGGGSTAGSSSNSWNAPLAPSLHTIPKTASPPPVYKYKNGDKVTYGTDDTRVGVVMSTSSTLIYGAWYANYAIAWPDQSYPIGTSYHWYDERDLKPVGPSITASKAPVVCKKCNTLNAHAEANQLDGSYICYECR